MWRTAKVRVTGSSHQSRDLPCQDSVGIHTNEDTVIVALSDGAGVAKFADIASQETVRASLEFLKVTIATAESLDRALAVKLLETCRQKLIELAAESGELLSEYSCTLLAAIIRGDACAVIQIGDGGWIAQRKQVFGAVTWPTGGEFVGQTVFVISKEAEKELQFELMQPSPKALIGFTDGIEKVSLSMREMVPHEPFFRPITEALEKAEDVRAFERQLEHFFASPRITNETDDDISVAVLVNLPVAVG